MIVKLKIYEEVVLNQHNKFKFSLLEKIKDSIINKSEPEMYNDNSPDISPEGSPIDLTNPNNLEGFNDLFTKKKINKPL